MKKINVFALIGLTFFNITIGIALFVTVYALLFSAWVTAFSFLVSPFLIIGAHIIGVQTFGIFNFLLGVLLCLAALLATPVLIKVSRVIKSLTFDYIKFNHDALYS